MTQEDSLRKQANGPARPGRPEEKISLQAQQFEAKIKADSADKQIKIIQEQMESLKIRAPQDGIITTWEPQKTLKGRPVEVGTELLQVAAVAGEWVMEVEVPDDDMGPVLDGPVEAPEGDRGGDQAGRLDRWRPTSSPRPTPSTATPATSGPSAPRPRRSRPSTSSR